MASGPRPTVNATTSRWQRPAPALSVSLMWAAKLSSASDTVAMPPWAFQVDPEVRSPLVSRATLYWPASRSARVMPAAPLPMTSTS